MSGVWMTFHNEAYENYWDIRPHASEADALAYLATQRAPLALVRFVPFGQSLDDIYET